MGLVTTLDGAAGHADGAAFPLPAHGWRPAAYWFWHHLPTPGESSRQIAQLRAGGFRTVLIQPRLAFPRRDYMSPAYLAAYRTAVEAAAAGGLEVGIYDDYNWASGHAGGRTVAGHDHLRERHLFWTGARIEGSTARMTVSAITSPFVDAMAPPVAQWYFEGGTPRWTGWTVVAALLHPAGTIAAESEIRDITPLATIQGDGDGAVVTVALESPPPPGHGVTVFAAARSTTSRMVNYLLAEAADRFIAVGCEPYAETLDGLLGDPVRYLFFDQPAQTFHRWREHHGALGNSLLWADRLQALFEARHGRPLGPTLLALVRDTGPASRLRRCDFFSLYSALLHENFPGRIARWARSLGLGVAGHEILAHVGAWGLNDGFPGIDPRVTIGVDHFAIERHRSRTTVDANNFEAQLSPKLGDSVARAHGRRRTMVEVYATATRKGVPRAAGLWDLDLATLRAQAIRLHLLGMRQLLFHAFWATDGHGRSAEPLSNPRFDFPPGINFEPWYPRFLAVADETARLSAFMEAAEPQARIAILYPLHTAWAEGPRHEHGAHVGAWARLLYEAGRDYLLIDERDLVRAELTPAGLNLAGQVFDTVILPAVTTLGSRRSLDMLAGLLGRGGRVIASGTLPAAAHGEGIADLRAEVRAVFAARGAVALPALPKPADLPPAAETEPRLRNDAAGLRRWLGREGRGWRIVLFNDGETALDAALDWNALGLALERWDAATGTVAAWGALGHLRNRAWTSLRLAPGEIACLRAAAGGRSPPLLVTGTAACYQDDGASFALRPGEQAGLAWEGAMPSLQAAVPLDVSKTAAGRAGVVPATPWPAALAVAAGWSFRPGEAAQAVAIRVDRGWDEQGFAAFSGIGTYTAELDLPAAAGFAWELLLPLAHGSVELLVGGRSIGHCDRPPYRFALPADAAGRQRLTLAIANTAANRYYAGTPYDGPAPSGLGAAPVLSPALPVRAFLRAG